MAQGPQKELNWEPERDSFASMTDRAQLDLFADRAPIEAPSNGAATTPRLPPGSLSDAALIAALPGARLLDGCALAAETGRRRLSGAVTALVALCNRFVGFGADCRVPEQAAALEALAAIGGPEAARSVAQMIVKEIVQGPTLAVAVSAASQLGVKFPHLFALRLLRHSDPAVRAPACDCVRAGPEIVAALSDLLDDGDRENLDRRRLRSRANGRAEARDPLKRCLNQCPSPRVIEAMAGVADDETVVFLARIGRARPEPLAQFSPRSTRSITRGRPPPRPASEFGFERIHLSRRLVES